MLATMSLCICIYPLFSYHLCLSFISNLCIYAELAAAEMQLLRQALDKLQSETRILDDELARAREQAIFSEFERAELSHELETVSAQLQASQASKAELEDTISKVGVEATAADHSMHICVQLHVQLEGLANH